MVCKGVAHVVVFNIHSVNSLAVYCKSSADCLDEYVAADMDVSHSGCVCGEIAFLLFACRGLVHQLIVMVVIAAGTIAIATAEAVQVV